MYQLTKLENNLESVLKNFSITEKIDIKLTRNESFDLQINNLVKFKDNPNYTLINGNIADKETIKEIFVKYKPEVVVNFAAETHVDRSILNPDDFIKTNIFI
jgi:dTDP-D-glucose 4,6-dehydratase